MPKSERFRTYLVAVNQRRETTRVYALVAQSAAEALEIVTAQASDDVMVEVAGTLSDEIAKPYNLKPGDLVLI